MTRRQRILAGYDSATSRRATQRHWLGADDRSARAALNHARRKTVRRKARLELENNPHAIAMRDNVCHYAIGTGPRLQLMMENRAAEKRVQQLWKRWSAEVNLPDLLRVMLSAQIGDGEAFGRLITDAGLSPMVPDLDIVLYEAEQIADPRYNADDRDNIDGVIIDERTGRAMKYWLLKDHPGDTWPRLSTEYETVDAADMIHLFRPTRPGQVRGISELASCLELFAQLRSFQDAVLQAARTAAGFSVIFKHPGTKTQAGSSDDDEWETESGVSYTLPEGWEAQQLDPKQPSTTYRDFQTSILADCGRALCQPKVLVTGDSSGHTFSSVMADGQAWEAYIRATRQNLEARVLNRLLNAFLDTAALTEGLLPQKLRARFRDVDWQWLWPAWPHVDPVKDATAAKTRKEAGHTTLAIEAGRLGHDWQDLMDQRLTEEEYATEIGLAGHEEVENPGQPEEEPTDDFGEPLDPEKK